MRKFLVLFCLGVVLGYDPPMQGPGADYGFILYMEGAGSDLTHCVGVRVAHHTGFFACTCVLNTTSKRTKVLATNTVYLKANLTSEEKFHPLEIIKHPKCSYFNGIANVDYNAAIIRLPPGIEEGETAIVTESLQTWEPYYLKHWSEDSYAVDWLELDGCHYGKEQAGRPSLYQWPKIIKDQDSAGNFLTSNDSVNHRLASGTPIFHSGEVYGFFYFHIEDTKFVIFSTVFHLTGFVEFYKKADMMGMDTRLASNAYLISALALIHMITSF